MSYTEEVYERVVAQNPGEPEFQSGSQRSTGFSEVVIDKMKKNTAVFPFWNVW